MGWTDPRDWVTGEVITEAMMDEQVSGNAGFLKKNIALESALLLTISGGVVTKTQTFHRIDTEYGASSDDLDTINGGGEGEVLIICAYHGDHTVIVKNGTGNIVLQADYSLDTKNKILVLVYYNSKWQQLRVPIVTQYPYGSYSRSHYGRNTYI